MNLDKKSVFEEGLKDPKVQVHVFKAPGLLAPDSLKYPTMFEYGLNMPNPIHGLVCDEQGIKATLSFNQEPYSTFVPWSAVLAIAFPQRGIAISWKIADGLSLEPPPDPPAKKKPFLRSV